MRNVTISMQDELLAAVRVRAAKQGKSVSRYVADVMARDAAEPQRDPEKMSKALEAFFALPLMDLSDEEGRLPNREEIYAERDEELFRRRERLLVPPGQEE